LLGVWGYPPVSKSPKIGGFRGLKSNSKESRIMGLDIGEKRIGVALSDPLGIIASALTVIERRTDDAAIRQIVELARQSEVERIVIGLPRSLDGSMGRQAQTVQAFIELLKSHTELPIIIWDERLSTVAAEKTLLEAGTKRDKRKRHRDAVAAAFILQGYLDSAKRP
jgi:putative Holliday junction resolvase